jgi:plastocyanin
MKNGLRGIAVLVGLLALGVGPAAAQKVHEIDMVSDGNGEFRFAPASIAVEQGDVLLFKAVSGAPHSVVFEGKDISPEARQALNQALPRRAGNLSSPLLTEGSEYRVVVPRLPRGTYRFFCLPHRAYDMRGEITLK